MTFHHMGWRSRSGVCTTDWSSASDRPASPGDAADSTASAHRTGSPELARSVSWRVASATAARAEGDGGGIDERPSTARTESWPWASRGTDERSRRSRASGSARNARIHRVNSQPPCDPASRR